MALQTPHRLIWAVREYQMYVQIVGIIVIIGALVFCGAFLFAGKKGRSSVAFLTCAAVFVGLGLVISDRITELTVRGIGTIKAASAQATADAGAIQALKTRVENQSATVDAIAMQATNAAGLSQKVASQIADADTKLAELNADISAAKAALSKLQADSEFAATVEEAQTDSRASFDKLFAIANDAHSPYAARAAEAWNTILESHSQAIYESGFTIPWRAGFNPAKLTLADLERLYSSAASWVKPGLLEYINNRTDIPKLDKLDFFIQVMRSDASLTAVEYAGRYFTMATNQKIKPLEVEYLSEWWKTHRKEYEKPTPSQ